MEISIVSGQVILLRNCLRSPQGFSLSVLKDFYSLAYLSSVSHLSYEVSHMISFLFFFLLFCPSLNTQLVKVIYVHNAQCFAIYLFIYLFSFLNFYLFIYYLWLCWVFASARGLSPAAASGGHSSSRCAGLSLSRPLPLRSTGSRGAGSAIVAHGPSCSTAYGILPDQGSNPCPLHWQADSQPLRHQGSPAIYF